MSKNQLIICCLILCGVHKSIVFGQQAQTLVDSTFIEGNVQNIIQAVDGMSSGVLISRAGSDPSKSCDARVRGFSTLTGQANPLVVVDGIPVNDILSVDLFDVKSVKWLKGADASKYGLLGGSGVLEITTRQIEHDKLTVNVNSFGSVESPIYKQRVLSSNSFLAMGGTDLSGNTDWIDQITRTGTALGNHIDISQQKGQIGCSLSANHRAIRGILEETNLNRVNLNGKVRWESKNQKWGWNVGSIYSNEASNPGYPESFKMAMQANPTMPVYFDSGDLLYFSQFDFVNPEGLIQTERSSKTAMWLNHLNIRGNSELFDWDVLLGVQDYSLVVQDDYRNTLDYFSFVDLYAYGAGETRYFGSLDLSKSVVRDRATWDISVGSSFNKISTAGDKLTKRRLDSIIYADSLNWDAFLSNHHLGINGKFNKLELGVDYYLVHSSALGDQAASGLLYNYSLSYFPLKEKSGNIDLEFFANMGVSGLSPFDNTLKQAQTFNGSILQDANPNLAFERQKHRDIGVSISDEKGRWMGSATYYRKKSADLLGIAEAISVCACDTELDQMITNEGELLNRGIELNFAFAKPITPKLLWNSDFQLTTLKTQWSKMPYDSALDVYLGLPGYGSTEVILYLTDQPFGAFYGPIHQGVDNRGDGQLVDQNGDNYIDVADDFKVIGQALPEGWIGWTNQFTYGPVSLKFMLKGVWGHDILDLTKMRLDYQGINLGTSNKLENSDNPSSGYNLWSDRMLQKGNYLRMQYLNLNYKLPFRKLQSSINFTVNNLFTLSKFSGDDPEVRIANDGDYLHSIYQPDGYFSAGNQNLMPGLKQQSEWLPTRSFVIGFNLSF